MTLLASYLHVIAINKLYLASYNLLKLAENLFMDTCTQISQTKQLGKKPETKHVPLVKVI